MTPAFFRMPRRNVLTLAQLFTALLCAAPGFTASLQPATAQAWERYLQWTDRRVQKELSDKQRFLLEDFLPAQEKASIKQQLAAGRIIVKRMDSPVPKSESFRITGGEIHHWWGGALVTGIKLPELLRFLEDYGRHAGRFADVEKSRLISRDGDFFRFYFRLKRSKAFVTVYYNTEQECVYTSHSPTRVSSRSVATRIAEIENPGTPSERERPPGDDRGFLWRLASWWRFEQTEQGVVVEVESASLSRDIPSWVKLLPGVSSYIRSTPKESIESILTSIRNYGKDFR